MPDRGQVDYDPARKYRKVWDVLVHNLNSVIKKGGKDVTMDETTWPNASYADVHGRTRGKKCGKGGQHVIVTDARRRYIYQYTARHSFHKKEEPYTQQGPAEVKRIMDDLAPLVQGNPKPATDKR